MRELNIEQEHKDFEEAYRAKWPTICAVNHRKFELDEENEYLDYTVQVALEMWLAAKRASMRSAEPVACVECGDGIVAHDPGVCGNCYAMKYRDAPLSTDVKDTERLNFITSASAWFCPGLKTRISAWLFG